MVLNHINNCRGAASEAESQYHHRSHHHHRHHHYHQHHHHHHHQNSQQSLITCKMTNSSILKQQQHTKCRYIWHSMSHTTAPYTPPLFLLFVLLLFTIQNHHTTDAFCPSKCQCLGGDANSRAYCVDAALEDVPIQLNPETKYINLTLNKIRNLQFTLPFYVKLEVLDLSQNIIETLGSKNFEYQTEMRTLNLSRNSVSSLQKDAFRGLSNLLLLDLSYNRIEIVHPSALGDLRSLIELDLTNNNIVSLEDNCFHNMISLEILIFKNNQLLDVPANNLQYLQALKSLDLSDNLIEYVRNDSFEGLRDLMMLTMRGNVISELDLSAFEGLNALKQLNLADNNLTMVPTQQLSRLSNLTYLSLSGNRFTYLSAVAFLNLFHLRELHLNRLDRLNRIDSRAFIDNTHLQSLHLSNNPQLTDIPMRLFQGNPNIIDVYMQGNNLQTLYAAQFPVDQLEKLYLGDNPLQCNCSLLWLWRLVTGNFEDDTHGDIHRHDDGAAVAALGVAKPSVTEDGEAIGSMAAYVADHKTTVVEENVAESERSPTVTATTTNGNYLKLDIERIGCDIWQDNVRTRRHLATMSESEITCPAHIVTIVCAVLTCLLVLMTGASIIFYLRFVKRRRKLMHDRSMRSGKSIINIHDRILQHQPLSGGGSGGGVAGNGIGGAVSIGGGGSGGGGLGLGSLGLGGGGGLNAYPHHTLQSHNNVHHAMHPLHHNEYHQTLPQQVDKLELERYLAAQAIANEYRALKPWELPIKDVTYSDEPEHLYEKFDHYEYPDTHTINKSQQATLSCNGSIGNGSIGGTTGSGNTSTASKPHVVYV